LFSVVTKGVKKDLPKSQGYHCFACGTSNPVGLGMSFYSLGNTVRSDMVLSEHHVGWENLAHGGIISTILDEIMGWTVIAFKRVFFVTRTIEVQYLRPVEVNSPITAIGEIEADFSPKGCSTKGVLLDVHGKKLAEGRAEMSYLSVKRLPLLPEQYKKDMLALFEQMRDLLG
jgi:acyl-coenzyme A thioesterase PaaI-like protein